MAEPAIETIEIELPGERYPVHLGAGIIASRPIWDAALPPGRLLVVSDDVVAPLYLEALTTTLSHRNPQTLVLPAGEANKTFDAWRTILDRLAECSALRDAAVIALGGGVIGDVAGFAAATYMRGIRFIQVPTTLLAQVDASVGGKTAINHPVGKNLVGAFHQPAAVVIDSETLASLPGREFAAGMAEVVKYGVIRDRKFFDWLEAHRTYIEARDASTILEMIARSVRNKAEVVAEDELEQGVRATLNFGHTFAHALETLTGYGRFLHGEAVAIGMVVAATLSEKEGICPAGCATRIRELLAGFGLPVAWPAEVPAERAFESMTMDKKALHSGVRLILVDEIGAARIDQGSSRRDIVRAIESNMEPAPGRSAKP